MIDEITVMDETISEVELKERLKRWNSENELKYEASLFKKRKRSDLFSVFCVCGHRISLWYNT
jgi:hypothetical protein